MHCLYRAYPRFASPRTSKTRPLSHPNELHTRAYHVNRSLSLPFATKQPLYDTTPDKCPPKRSSSPPPPPPPHRGTIEHTLLPIRPTIIIRFPPHLPSSQLVTPSSTYPPNHDSLTPPRPKFDLESLCLLLLHFTTFFFDFVVHRFFSYHNHQFNGIS